MILSLWKNVGIAQGDTKKSLVPSLEQVPVELLFAPGISSTDVPQKSMFLKFHSFSRKYYWQNLKCSTLPWKLKFHNGKSVYRPTCDLKINGQLIPVTLLLKTKDNSLIQEQISPPSSDTMSIIFTIKLFFFFNYYMPLQVHYRILSFLSSSNESILPAYT